MIINTLNEYEIQSAQKINQEKSLFFVYHKTAGTIVQIVEDITGFSKGKFPMIYLGCPIGHTRKRKKHFVELLKNIQNKLQAWKGKLLSFGGNQVLINNVLQSVSIYLLSAVIPPKYVIHDLHRIFAIFLWNFK